MANVGQKSGTRVYEVLLSLHLRLEGGKGDVQQTLLNIIAASYGFWV